MFIKLNKNDHGYTDIEITVDYNKGGYNYFSYTEEPRGYYLHVQPLTRGNNTITFTAFTGVKMLIEECKRLNRKRLAELQADEIELSKNAVTYLCNKYNLSIAD